MPKELQKIYFLLLLAIDKNALVTFGILYVRHPCGKLQRSAYNFKLSLNTRHTRAIKALEF